MLSHTLQLLDNAVKLYKDGSEIDKCSSSVTGLMPGRVGNHVESTHENVY